MNARQSKQCSRFTLVAVLFAVATLAIIYFLFDDVIQCRHDWGSFAEDCRQTFFLTLFSVANHWSSLATGIDNCYHQFQKKMALSNGMLTWHDQRSARPACRTLANEVG